MYIKQLLKDKLNYNDTVNPQTMTYLTWKWSRRAENQKSRLILKGKFKDSKEKNI